MKIQRAVNVTAPYLHISLFVNREKTVQQHRHFPGPRGTHQLVLVMLRHCRVWVRLGKALEKTFKPNASFKESQGPQDPACLGIRVTGWRQPEASVQVGCWISEHSCWDL